MEARDRAEVRVVCRWLMLASFVTLSACVHESKGESQLVWLQSSLESEFPDHGVSSTLDLSGKAEPPVHGAVAPMAPTAPAPAPVAAEEPSAPAPMADDPSARPVIRVVGTGKTRGAGHPANDHIEMTVPDERAPAVPAAVASLVGAKSSADPIAKQEYDRGLALLNARDYDHALEAFLAFLMRFPDDPNAEGAIYWTGECYLAKGELVDASEQFESALSRFPQGSKVPEDLLKLGLTAQRLGNKESAKGYFDRLSREFPKSDAVRRIPHDPGMSL